MGSCILTHRAEITDREGDYPTAERLLTESQTAWRAWDLKWFVPWTMRIQGRVAGHRGDLEAGLAYFREGVRLNYELGNRRELAMCLEDMAELVQLQQQAERAARLLGAAAALRERMGLLRPPVERSGYGQRISDLRCDLGETSFAAAWSAGQAMSMEEAVAEAGRDVPP